MKEDGKKELTGEYGRGDLIGVVRTMMERGKVSRFEDIRLDEQPCLIICAKC